LSRVIKAHEVTIEEGTAPGEPLRSERRASHAAGAAAQLLRQAQREAAALLARAERMVTQRLAELARKEEAVNEALEKARADGREAGFQEGYASGYREGFAKGEQEGLASVQELVQAVQSVLEEARKAQRSLEEQAREDVLKLAIAVAEKLVCRELSQDRAAALAILQQMLAKVEGSETARVRLPREVFALVEARRDAILEPNGTAGCQLEFVPDDALKAGDVLIETDWGLIDGRVQSRWRRIMQGLDLVEEEADGAE